MTTYYVSTSGNDTRTAAQASNPATPWLTIGKAFATALDAGPNTISVEAGDYAEGNGALTYGATHNGKTITLLGVGTVNLTSTHATPLLLDSPWTSGTLNVQNINIPGTATTSKCALENATGTVGATVYNFSNCTFGGGAACAEALCFFSWNADAANVSGTFTDCDFIQTAGARTDRPLVYLMKNRGAMTFTRCTWAGGHNPRVCWHAAADTSASFIDCTMDIPDAADGRWFVSTNNAAPTRTLTITGGTYTAASDTTYSPIRPFGFTSVTITDADMSMSQTIADPDAAGTGYILDLQGYVGVVTVDGCTWTGMGGVTSSGAIGGTTPTLIVRNCTMDLKGVALLVPDYFHRVEWEHNNVDADWSGHNMGWEYVLSIGHCGATTDTVTNVQVCWNTMNFIRGRHATTVQGALFIGQSTTPYLAIGNRIKATRSGFAGENKTYYAMMLFGDTGWALHNVLMGGGALYLAGAHNVFVLHNSCYGIEPTFGGHGALEIGTNTSTVPTRLPIRNVIMHNIFHGGTSSYAWYTSGAEADYSTRMDYNCYYPGVDATMASLGHTANTLAELQAFWAAAGHNADYPLNDAHSIVANPQYIDPSKFNLELQFGSPCLQTDEYLRHAYGAWAIRRHVLGED